MFFFYRCRNAFDDLGHKVQNFAEEEKINYSLSDGLNSITTSLTVQADYMDLLVHRLEMKVKNYTFFSHINAMQ